MAYARPRMARSDPAGRPQFEPGDRELDPVEQASDHQGVPHWTVMSQHRWQLAPSKCQPQVKAA
jgi:hypothetical protein